MSAELQLLSPGSAPNLFYKRALKKTDHQPIPHRWHYVLALHLAGKSAEEVSELTDYAVSTIYKILKEDAVVAVRQQILDGVQLEFEALYAKAVQTLRAAFDNPDPTIQMQAVNSFFKEKGRLEGKGQQFNITAEDVVVNILNQARGQ